MIDWDSTDDKVAEGRLVSSDPRDFVNDIPLGPNAVKVLVENAIKPDAFLWRPGSEMDTIDQAVGEMIAWQITKCFLAEEEEIPVMVKFRTHNHIPDYNNINFNVSA